MRFIRMIYRYIKYTRHDVYMTSKWLQDFDAGYKDSLIIH